MALTFQDLYESYQQHTSDTSASNLAIGKERINSTNKTLMALNEWYFAEKIQTFTPTADDYQYDLPYDYMRMVAVTINLDDVVYTLDEIPSHDEWQRIHVNRETETNDTPEFYHVTGDSLEIYPIPSSTAVTATGTMYYIKRVADMVADDYTAGTVTLASGSTVVTGSSTTFTSAMAGRFIKGNNDGRWFEIQTFTSTIVLALKKAYQGIGGSGLSYTIGEMSPIPEEYHNLLWYEPVALYWAMKKQPQQAAYYQALYDRGRTEFFNAYQKRSRVQLLRTPERQYYGRRTAEGSWPDPDYY